MESLTERIEKVLNFLSVIQNACDGKRLKVEQYSRKCFLTYLAELKKNEARQDLKSLPFNHDEKKEKKAALLSEGVEELAIADSLLEKARALRSKNKKFLKLEEPTLSTSLTSLDFSSQSNVINSPIRTVQEKMLRSQSSHTLLSHSKSSSNLEHHKPSKLYHSNSLGDEVCMKRTKVPNGRTITKNTLTESSSFCKSKLSKNSDVGVISYKEFKDLRKCPIGPNNSKMSYPKPTSEISQSHCIVPKSDSSQCTFKKSVLSYQSFKDSLKGKIQSNFQCKKDGFWYPFINSKSEKCLLDWAKCNTCENFLKIIKLIYKIQEIMFWIDLLYLIGKDIFPIILNLDENDKNVVRFCSSLLSIYHEHLQRIPLLNSE